MGSESKRADLHVLLVSFPAQGHINPLLRLGKRLASKGLFVTFTTTESAGKDLRNANDVVTDKAIPIDDGFLRFEFFDDGWAEDDPRRNNLSEYLPQLELIGKQAVSQMIEKHNDEGSIWPISCIINNPFVPWVCDVASEFGIPSAMLWVQSGALFTAYYYYLHKLVPFPSDSEPHIDVHLPSLPLLKYNEIPTILHSSSPFHFFAKLILEQFNKLSKTVCILMDTFEELEHDYMTYVSKFFLIRSVGPLFKNPRADSATNSIRGDLVKKADDCIEWLNSKPSQSVVYISFGSIVCLPQQQVNEIAYGLLDSQVSFLWVLIKRPHEAPGLDSPVLPDGFLETTGDKGKVVQWSPQEGVLAHPSVACFLTHCGWNSSMEAITCGVPVLTFPAWGDQVTNAKFLVDVFGVGVRLGNVNKLIPRDEVKKCLEEATIGPKAEELKKNALRWKSAAEAAIADGGSSCQNLDAFLEDVRRIISSMNDNAKITTQNQERSGINVE